MTYDLYIGDRMYSSWSLRGWLMFEKFALPHRVHMIGLYSGTMADDMKALAPARLVPAIRLPDGSVLGESIAMAETLAERHPKAGLWPSNANYRAAARWLCAEMAAGFTALRAECPMQLRHVWEGFETSEGVRSDLDRIEVLWEHARSISQTESGPLFGAYSLADVFYTPVAARIIGYDLPVSAASRAYCQFLMSDPALISWRMQALEIAYDPEPYSLGLPRKNWPTAT